MNLKASVLAVVALLYCTTCVAQSVWPLPQQMSTSSGVYVVNSNSFAFILQSTHNEPPKDAGTNPAYATNVTDIMNQAFSRYKKLLFLTTTPTLHLTPQLKTPAPLNGLAVQISSSSVKLDYNTDESYSLNIVSPTAQLKANTVFGALRGLETFSQLVFFNASYPAFVIQSVPITINDYPRFPHRGLLVDSARHFQPVANLLRSIDALAYNRMNVLHWHVVDAESFPMTSQSFPALTKGAYSSSSTYSQAEVQQVVLYGLYRGVRVIPEFDTPGHAASWGKGYPITANCPRWSANINNVPLSPAVNLTMEVVSGFMAEMGGLFLDDFLHTGGDEVVYGCWNEDGAVLSWMQKNGISTFDGVMSWYETQLWNIMKNNNKNVIAWEEVFSSYGLHVPSDVIIQVWKDEPTLLSVAKAGLRGLLSYGWYLDHMDQSWVDFYNNEPFVSAEWNGKLESFILGGEVSAWGEQVNFANLDQTVWPRGAATAERLWSAQGVNDPNGAQPRLVDHICRLNRRGIMSAPIQPNYCY